MSNSVIIDMKFRVEMEPEESIHEVAVKVKRRIEVLGYEVMSLIPMTPAPPATTPAPDSKGRPLKDTDPMPFGKHKGVPMQDVPVGYLHWVYTQVEKDGPVIQYIKDNLDTLRCEDQDLIWERPS